MKENSDIIFFNKISFNNKLIEKEISSSLEEFIDSFLDYLIKEIKGKKLYTISNGIRRLDSGDLEFRIAIVLRKSIFETISENSTVIV